MISGATRGRGGSALGGHLAKGEARPGESRGLISESIKDQVAELTKLASRAENKRPLYHCFARPPEGAEWRAEDFKNFWEKFEAEFGLGKQPFTEAIHDDDGHRHRVYSLVKPSGACIRMDNDFARREKLARVVEFERGERLTPGAHNRAVVEFLRHEAPEVAEAMIASGLPDGPKPVAGITPTERHQQERTAITKADVAKATAVAWKSSDNPQAFMAALQDAGFVLAQGEKCPVVVDHSGNTHSLTRMLAMHARSHGEPAPRAADIQARLAGVELPSLEQAREQLAPVPPVEVAAVNPQPDPTPPQPSGGVPAEFPSSSMATSTDGEKNAPTHTGAHAGGTPSPKSGGGGGGGSSSSPSPEQSSPLPSLDVGNGPGEPPGHNATPQQKAEYAAKLAAYEDRKAKAWLAWLKAWEAQNTPKKGAHSTGGGSSDVHDEKELRRLASDLIREITNAAERSAALRAFYNAWDEFKRGDEGPAQGVEGPGTGAPSADPDSSRSEFTGARHARNDDAAEGREWTAGDDRNHERNRGHPDAPGPHRSALEIAAERIATDRALSLSDPSALRAAMRGPDPLEGLEGKERKTKLDELNKELHSEFRASQREDFSEALARERMRSHPLAKALREGGRHLNPDEKSAAWSDIKEAHAALVARLKEQQKANQKAGFLQFLEFRSHTDSRALAVFEDMKAKAERARKIRAELSKGDARVAELRSSEPIGERDPDKAAQAAKMALYDRLREVQEQVKEAQKNLSETPRPSKLARWIAALGFNVESVKQRASAEQALERAMTHEKAVTPHYLDIDAATGKARNAAVLNERAHAAWRAGPGAELATLEPRMAEIHAAVDRKDWRITDALATIGIDAALDEVRKREEREERKRQEEARKAEYGARVKQRGQVVEFPGSAGPRMR
jgi:hypothetical protein